MYAIFDELCKKHNVTPYRVCKETGLTTATISNWKAGRYKPKADKLQKIANFFGVSLEYLTTGKEETVEEQRTSNDLKDKFEEIESLLKSGKMKPLRYDGEPIDDNTIDLLLKQVEISLAMLEK